MHRGAGLPNDFKLVFHPSHPDSYELSSVLLGKPGSTAAWSSARAGSACSVSGKASSGARRCST